MKSESEYSYLTLYFLTRTGVRDCEVCGMSNVGESPVTGYRASILAFEMLTDEQWRGVPNGSVVVLDDRSRTQILPIGVSHRVRA